MIINTEHSCFYVETFNGYKVRGSVERVLDERQETDQFAYDPFGSLTLGYSDNVNSNSLVHRTGNMYTYNGEDYNRETGLQFLRARWYDMNRAVFLSEDSYLGDLLQPLTRNRYLYVCNNPLNFIDPTGHINWSRQLKYLTATVLGLAVGAAALAAFPAPIAVRCRSSGCNVPDGECGHEQNRSDGSDIKQFQEACGEPEDAREYHG